MRDRGKPSEVIGEIGTSGYLTKTTEASGAGPQWKLLTFGNWTVYMDIRVPFTNRVIVLDIGRHPGFGWRYKR